MGCFYNSEVGSVNVKVRSRGYKVRVTNGPQLVGLSLHEPYPPQHPSAFLRSMLVVTCVPVQTEPVSLCHFREFYPASIDTEGYLNSEKMFNFVIEVIENRFTVFVFLMCSPLHMICDNSQLKV